MVAITSNPPFEIRLERSAGSYSQIAALFSTTAVFVICDITSMVARLITCAIHLSNISIVVRDLPVYLQCHSHVLILCVIPCLQVSTSVDFCDSFADYAIHGCVIEGHAI
jgi:hypothetical protein